MASVLFLKRIEVFRDVGGIGDRYSVYSRSAVVAEVFWEVQRFASEYSDDRVV